MTLAGAATLMLSFASLAERPQSSTPQTTDYGWLIEAEACRPNADCHIAEDPSASNGAGVASASAWQPLARVLTLPQDVPESFEVWTRRRGGPVCLKALSPDGSQKELGWTWGAPARWTWQKAGTFKREALSGGLLVIRDGDKSRTTELDAIAVVTNATLAAMAFAPPPIDVALKIDWSVPTSHPITARHWAVNDYEIVRAPEPSAAFDAVLRDLKPAIIRIHHASLVDTWSDAETRSWDVAKIRAAFDRMPAYEGVPIMVNINNWPRWFHDGPTLPAEKQAAFAALCADLVRIFRDELHQPVAYWEVLNEQDNRYEKAEALPALWQLLATVMDAMHAADPKAKIGGPALTWPKAEWTEGFLDACGDQIDFLSWHNYASGSRDDSTESILTEKVNNICTMARYARDAVAHPEPNRHIETFLTEYNISWSWETRDPRMTNHIGAIFDALVVMGVAEVGIDGAFVWHVKDNIYGLVDSQNVRRPAYQLFSWGGRYLVGKMLPVADSEPSALQLLAVRRADGGRSLLLVNRSDAVLVLPAPRALLGVETPILEGCIDAETCADLRPLAQPDAPLQLRPLSIRLLVGRN